MRRFTASLAGMLMAGALVLTGCGAGADAGHGTHTAAPSGAMATPSGPHNPADVMFARMMIPHHRQAIAMAEMADGPAGPQVERLAAAIKAAQGPEIATMTRWLRAWGAPVPADGMGHGMDHGSGMMSDADMKRLKAMSGADFDHGFLTMMIEHHRGAVTMARTERREGASPAAKALAASIITAQNREIAKMRGLLKPA